MAVEVKDVTGEPPSLEDIKEAHDLVMRYRIKMDWAMKNPEFYVQLSNIQRCLEFAATFAKPRK